MTPSAIDHLASQAVGSVREIEGTVTRLRATASLFYQGDDATIGIDAVTRLLRTTPPTSLPIRIMMLLRSLQNVQGSTVQT